MGISREPTVPVECYLEALWGYEINPATDRQPFYEMFGLECGDGGFSPPGGGSSDVLVTPDVSNRAQIEARLRELRRDRRARMARIWEQLGVCSVVEYGGGDVPFIDLHPEDARKLLGELEWAFMAGLTCEVVGQVTLSRLSFFSIHFLTHVVLSTPHNLRADSRSFVSALNMETGRGVDRDEIHAAFQMLIEFVADDDPLAGLARRVLWAAVCISRPYLEGDWFPYPLSRSQLEEALGSKAAQAWSTALDRLSTSADYRHMVPVLRRIGF